MTKNMCAMQRKFLLAFFGAFVALVVAASAAYACVPFKGDGEVAVTGTPDIFDTATTPQNSGTFTGTPTGGSLRYCESGTTQPGWDTGPEAQADGGDVIVVTVKQGSTTCTEQLDAGNYSVIVNNATTASASPFTLVTNAATVNVWSIVKTTGCFTSATPNGNITLTTSFSVNAAGDGTGTFVLPSMNRVDGTNAASSLCVGRGAATGSAQGIFVPLKITDEFIPI